MANQDFVIWTDEEFTKTDAGIDGNGTFELALSDSVSNILSIAKLELIIEYANIDPDFGAIPQSFIIDAVVEAERNNKWYPIAYQFSSYKNNQSGSLRIIKLETTLSGFDAGVDDIIFAGNTTIARVSRQQGGVPGSGFRVKLLVTEFDHGGAGAFESVTISASGELYDL